MVKGGQQVLANLWLQTVHVTKWYSYKVTMLQSGIITKCPSYKLAWLQSDRLQSDRLQSDYFVTKCRIPFIYLVYFFTFKSQKKLYREKIMRPRRDAIILAVIVTFSRLKIYKFTYF